MAVGPRAAGGAGRNPALSSVPPACTVTGLGGTGWKKWVRTMTLAVSVISDRSSFFVLVFKSRFLQACSSRSHRVLSCQPGEGKICPLGVRCWALLPRRWCAEKVGPDGPLVSFPPGAECFYPVMVHRVGNCNPPSFFQNL